MALASARAARNYQSEVKSQFVSRFFRLNVDSSSLHSIPIIFYNKDICCKGNVELNKKMIR